MNLFKVQNEIWKSKAASNLVLWLRVQNFDTLILNHHTMEQNARKVIE